jgi:hypothetical protein
MVNALAAVSAPRRAALEAANQPIPPPVRIRALVDTGASCTCIDPTVLAQLQLTPTGSTQMITPSTGQTPVVTEQYDVGIYVPGPTGADRPLAFPTLPVVASDLQLQGFQALIGRDVLSRCILYYNGDFGLFTLGY